MSEHDRKHDDDADRQVGRAYREWSDEQTPAALDRAVLAYASDEVAARRRGPVTWFRPLAFAATVVLGVALILEIRPELDPAAERPAALSDRPAATDAGATPDTTADSDARERAAPGTPPAPARYKPSEPRATTERALTEEREAVPPAGDAEAAPEPRETPRLDKLELKEAPSAGRSAVSDGRHCTAGQTADAESWQRCIDALRDAGDATAAEQETARFRRHYPDYRGNE